MNRNSKNKGEQHPSLIGELATSLSRRDEIPNVELAKRIAEKEDKEAVKQLFDLLANPKEGLRNDAVKVIYEAATISPGLLAPFTNDLISLLKHQSNRLQWGAMIALDKITLKRPDAVFGALKQIIAAADKGSVITNDHCVSILIKLCSLKEYAGDVFPLFIARLKRSPVNQLPMYAEQAVTIQDAKTVKEFIDTLIARLGEMEKASKRLRVEKIIRKMTKTFSL